MEFKDLLGKTVFFALICLFVAAFSWAFGAENSLTGVMVVVLALMMLGKDLSVRPLMNMFGLLAMTLAMALCAYVSTWSGNAFVGLAVNLLLVFAVTYLTTQDLRSPLHFPFLLGYAFMLAVPVSPDQLPVRIVALVAGSAIIVALNVLVNRGRHDRTCRDGIVSVCEEVSRLCGEAAEGRDPSPSGLDDMCLRLRGSIYDRLKASFFTTPGDRRVLDLLSSLQTVGRAVCSSERDAGVLRSVADLMEAVASHERGGMTAAEVSARFSSFASAHPQTDRTLSAALEIARRTLVSLESGGREDHRGRMRAMAREGFRTDSARFSFALRMSVMFALWGFVWQYWELENAKWLLFTTVALVLPYVDGAWRKSAMRLTGTLVGVAAFAVVLVLVGGDVGLLSAALILANYAYTVLDPKRYDVMMVFITFSALVAASMSAPADDAMAERVAFILLGVLSATAANYLLVPYRISDENSSLVRRYASLTSGMLASVRAALEGGTADCSADSLAAAAVSSKLHMNLEAEPDGEVSLMLSSSDLLAAQCPLLCREASALSPEGRECALRVMDGVPPGDVPQEDAAYIALLSSAVSSAGRGWARPVA